jgi:hypothetical protein
MPLILGTNSIKDTGYNVANSVRLDASYMKRTVTPSTSNTWTLSFWLKKSGHNGSSEGYLFSYGADGGQGFYITNAGYLGYYGAGGYSSDSTLSQGVLRDVSAWYHICFSVSSGTGTLYINGVQDATISNVAPLNATTGNTYAVNSYINYEANFDNFLGYMAEYVFIDGTAYNQNSFGEFDSDSPTIWKPIDVSGLTFGTNGFYLDFADSSDLGKDVSGNSNHFTTTGLTATDQSTDTCTNNFATLNPLYHYSGGASFSEGNLKFTTSGNSSVGRGMSTIRPESGKWYVECKIIDVTRFSFGLMNGNETNSSQGGENTNSVIFGYDGGFYMAGGFTGYLSAPSNNDIVQLALDLDNDLFWIGINDTWGNSATRTQIENGTASNDATTFISSKVPINTGAIGIFVEDNSSTGNNVCEINFGSPSFSISSGNADANGYGNFEYSVPSGYYALNTKNLAEFG